LLATVDKTPPCTVFPTPVAPGVWFQLVGRGTFVRLDTCDNNAFDTELSVFKGDCGSLSCVEGDSETCGQQSIFSWFAELDETYRVLVHGGLLTSKGPFTLAISESPAYSRCEQAILLDPEQQSTYLGSTWDGEFARGAIAGLECTLKSEGVWYRLIGTGRRVCQLKLFSFVFTFYGFSPC